MWLIINRYLPALAGLQQAPPSQQVEGGLQQSLLCAQQPATPQHEQTHWQLPQVHAPVSQQKQPDSQQAQQPA